MNGPAIWDRLIASLNEAVPHERFIIVGGAVRDYSLGLIPKDIDVAVAIHSREALEDIIDALEEHDEFNGVVLLEYTSDEAAKYEEVEAGALVGVIDLAWTFNGVTMPIQIIARPAFQGGPVQGVAQFDWGILQQWWERGNPQPLRTEIAQNDLDSLTATLTQSNAGLLERSIERFKSFNDRHPGLLIPYTKDGEVIDFDKQGEFDL